MRKGGPVAVLLLPDRLERFARREQAQELLRAPAVVAVEPGLMPFSFVVRAPERTLRRTSGRQAKRLLRRLPGRPVAVVVFDVLQWPLARELAERAERCEVWLLDPPLAPTDDAPATRLRALEDEAAGAAALRFAAGANEPLWDRLAVLGIALHEPSTDR